MTLDLRYLRHVGSVQAINEMVKENKHDCTERMIAARAGAFGREGRAQQVAVMGITRGTPRPSDH